MTSASPSILPCYIEVQKENKLRLLPQVQRVYSGTGTETRNVFFASAELHFPAGKKPFGKTGQPLAVHPPTFRIPTAFRQNASSSFCGKANAGKYLLAEDGELDRKVKVESSETEDVAEEDDEVDFEDDEPEFDEGGDIDEIEDSEEAEWEADSEWIEEDEEQDVQLGDGGQGGGIIRPEAEWGRLALAIAEKLVEVGEGGEEALAIYAFRVDPGRGVIRLRLDKPSDKYGSPSVEEIEFFSRTFSGQLDDAVAAGTMRADFALEVSSPGAERVVKVPSELNRFSALPMYVKYRVASDKGEVVEEEILELVEVDDESGSATWKVANVKINREVAGKGRGLTKKQRERRIRTPFEDVEIVRVYVDI